MFSWEISLHSHFKHFLILCALWEMNIKLNVPWKIFLASFSYLEKSFKHNLPKWKKKKKKMKCAEWVYERNKSVSRAVKWQRRWLSAFFQSFKCDTFFETITESDLCCVKLKLTLMRMQMAIFHFCDEIVSVSHNLINFIARISLSTEIPSIWEWKIIIMPVIYIRHAFNIRNHIKF